MLFGALTAAVVQRRKVGARQNQMVAARHKRMQLCSNQTKPRGQCGLIVLMEPYIAHFHSANCVRFSGLDRMA